ncbi:MAG: zinc dependent phospholipase C family protein [Thermodesulfovibrionales bacterium]|nr:zinc dependent phospholipase C family protein [Thermodesulfovibrionales bacterium]
MIFLLSLFGFLLMPSLVFAWGPLTHTFLANEIYTLTPLIPAGIMTLLRKYRQDFLYGNLMADMILGKKYLPDDKSSHSWEMGLKLFDQAERDSEKAFVYGYQCHLAADTVAHEMLTEDRRNMGHAWLEMKADSIINKVYWLESVTISKTVQKRNDRFLEDSLDRFIFSFNTNKRIYKSMVFLSFLNKKRKRGVDKKLICDLHDESIAGMLDLLQNGENADVLNKSPL